MNGKWSRWLGCVLLALALPRATQAGPYIGDWGWCWKPAPGCPKGCYSPCHYWTPAWYRVVYHCWPAYIDQYPPGLPVPVGWEIDAFPCRTVPPFPSSPYANPAGFYNRRVVPTEEETREKEKQDKTKE